MKKILTVGGIIVVALVLVGAGALFLRRANQPAAADINPSTAVVTRGYIEETVSATGNVVADREVTLGFETSGPIAEVWIEEGQQVEAGQVLARLDTASLEWQVARSQASLDTAQARLKQALKPTSAADLASAEAALDSARANHEKVKGGPSTADSASAQAALDSARANYEKVRAGPTEADLASAKAALDSARASLQQAQAAYDQIKDQPNAQMLPQSLTLQNATIEYQRAQANYDAVANHPTASELASAAAQVAQAEAQLASLQERPTASELASAAAQVAQAEAQLASLQERPEPEDVAVIQAQVEEAAIVLAQAQAQLDDTVISAPFAGTVLTVNARQGEWASPGAPAIVLAVTDPLILAVNIDEVDVAQLADGQMAYLGFDALQDAEILGTVSQIAPASTNVAGAVAYSVQISFDPGDLAVRLGMTADVDIVVASDEDALLVPNRGIEADREAGRYYVTRQKALGSLERLEVRIGLRDAANTQILEGLEEGDQVALPEVPGQGGDEGAFGPPHEEGGFFGGMRQRSGGQ